MIYIMIYNPKEKPIFTFTIVISASVISLINILYPIAFISKGFYVITPYTIPILCTLTSAAFIMYIFLDISANRKLYYNEPADNRSIISPSNGEIKQQISI